MERTVKICNLNFHASMGGTQHTLGTILQILNRRYAVAVVDPYGLPQFRSLMAEKDIQMDRVTGLSFRIPLSTKRGWRRIPDYLSAAPAYLRFAVAFRRYLIQTGVNLLYVNQTKSAVLAALAAPRSMPIIFHCHAASANMIGLVSRFGARFSRVIANSPFTGRELIRIGFPEDRIAVVTNAIDVEEVRRTAAQKPETPLPPRRNPPIFLIAHAGIEPNKGTLLAADAFGKLAQQGLPGELWIAGEVAPQNMNYSQQVRKLVERRSISDRVHFIGRRNDIWSVMAKADVVVVPSVFEEPFGRVAVEAMALGKPVVASNRGALPTVVDDGQTGRVFDPDDAQSLADVLADLARNVQSREELGRKGLDAVRQKYGIERFEREILAVFDDCLQQYQKTADQSTYLCKS